MRYGTIQRHSFLYGWLLQGKFGKHPACIFCLCKEKIVFFYPNNHSPPMNSRNLLILIGLSILSLLSACNPKKEEKAKEALVSLNPREQALQERIQRFFANSPSPIEIITYIYSAELPYTPEYLNSALLYDKYLTTNLKKSLNLGVYLSDLGYTCLYYKPQDAITYLKTCKAMFTELGILEAFDSSMIIRFERNLDSRDSLISIMREAVSNSNDYLAANERNDIAAMIVTGSWVEGMYMATNSIRGRELEEKSQKVIWKIGEQKATLDSLIAIVDLVNDQGFSQKMHHQLSELKKAFDDVKYVEEKAPDQFVDISKIDKVEEVTELTVINDARKVQISLENLDSITDQLEAIRKEMVE